VGQRIYHLSLAAGRIWGWVRKQVVSENTRHRRERIFQIYIIAALGASALLALLAFFIPYFPFDLHTNLELQEDLPGWIGLVLQAVSWPGYAVQSALVVAISLLILAGMGLRWEAVAGLFAAVFSGALNTLLKLLIHRPRPSSSLVEVFSLQDSYSFPSGHVMFYCTFFGFMVFLAFVLFKPTLRRSLFILALIFLIVTVGISRIYLGEHWASDVAGGYLLGSLCLILTLQFYRWGKKHFFQHQPVAAEANFEE
jgi:membrane-associated phospholipid phosphatase